MKQLLWVMVVLGACLGLTTGASAVLVDNFDYGDGALLTNNGWIAHSGAGTQPIDVYAPGLAYPLYPTSNVVGQAARLDNNGEDAYRPYAQSSGVVYYAFLVNVPTSPGTAGYFAMLNGSTSDFWARVNVAATSPVGSVYFGISNTATAPTSYPASFALNTTHLIVVKYDSTTGWAYLWVDPALTPCVEPTPLQTSLTAVTGKTSIGFALRQFATNERIYIDGLRIGTTWDEVVCSPPTTGACCDALGGCVVRTSAECATAGGAYQGDGTTCSPNPCPQLGTCCIGGVCTFVLQANCTGVWTLGGACSPNPCTQPTGSCCALDGTCTLTTQANCTGTWTLNGVCVPNTCVQPTGSCCYPDGTCAVTLSADCTGTWTVFGVCVPNTCPQPTGACCLPSGLCTVGTAGDCAVASGVYQGNGTTCTPNPCPAGLLFDESFNYTAGDSVAAHGWVAHSYSNPNNTIYVTSPGLTYPGYPSSGIGNAATVTNFGEDVHVNFAAQTSGTVYYAFMVNFSAANTAGDYFIHFGKNGWTNDFYARVYCKKDVSNKLAFGVTKYNETPVDYTGYNYDLGTTYLLVVSYTFVTGTINDVISLWVNPICDPPPSADLTYTDTLKNDATNIGGLALRQGTLASAPTETVDGIRVGTSWADVVCGIGVTGACCAADGSCSMKTAADCSAAGGAYYGGGTSCSPNPCPQLGTCCALGGTCTFVLQANCAGAWTSGGACDPNPCTQPVGSCCAVDGTCTLTTQANCTVTWTEGGACVPNVCVQPNGSCCYSDGTCAVTLLAGCTGTWTMFGVCDPNTCAQPTGACCLPTGLCTVGTAAACAVAGGVYQGNGTICVPNPCPAPVKTLCEVAEDDVNGVAVLVGQRVTVQGIALCGGMTWSTTIREFQITDGTCCIDVFGGALTPVIALGDLVQITGTVANYNGKTELTTPDLTVTVLSSGNPIPTPGVTTTGTLAAAGEPFESCLFTIYCVSIVSGTWPAAGLDANIVIDDGTGPVTMRIDKDTDIDGSPAPVGPFTVTGVGDQYHTATSVPPAPPYNSFYQIKPRSLADLVSGCAIGACCKLDGSCVLATSDGCLALSGTYQGDGTTCPPTPACPSVQGSCCYLDGTCAVMAEAPCTGTWTLGGVCDPNTCFDPAGVGGGELDGVLSVRAKPNPFAGNVSLRVAGPNATAARVLIFDAAGRLVRTAWSGMLNGRAFNVTWDGRDDSGREAATGIYMARIESESGHAIGRLVKLR